MILKKYPEVKKLFGYDPWIAVPVTLTVIMQLVMGWLVRDAPWKVVIPLAWIVSATLNHSLGGAIHEIGHNLAFGHKRPLWNRALGMLANLPYMVPMSVSYKKYHADHHRYLG
jgi:sphingolipid 4-desaturase/C4-monooxygenase